MMNLNASRKAFFAAAIATYGLIGGAQLQAAPPAPNGQALFKTQCAACHATVAGKKSLGPSMAGIANRQAGTVPGFAYSPAMKNSKLKWDRKSLDRYLANPRTTVPGTKMMFAGQKDAAKRSALVQYLLSLK